MASAHRQRHPPRRRVGVPVHVQLLREPREDVPRRLVTDVTFWISKAVGEAKKRRLNDVSADTAKWEQSVAHTLDTNPAVAAFVKNEGLAVPYFHNGQDHEYSPDLLVRLACEPMTH